MGRKAWALQDFTKILPSEVGKPEGREHRQEEATDMLHMQNKVPVGRSHEEPCKKRPPRTQTSKEKGGDEQEVQGGHRNNRPHLREKLHKSEDDETTYEDGTRGNSRVTDV